MSNRVALVEKFDKLSQELDSVRAELAKEFGFGVAPTVAPVAVPESTEKKTAPKKRAGRKKGDGEQNFPSLKSVVQSILAKHPEGLEVKQIVHEVDGMIKRKEYHSGAKSLSAVVSQAVNALKQEDVLNHDRENKKYSLKTTAA